MIYPSQMSLRSARERYFRLNDFGKDGGYDERWIKVKVWRIPIWLPNTAGRVEAVRLHDLHHVLTEYPTTWRGEAEISAWEVGSGGLRRFWAGWWLDLMNVAQGLVINPVGVYRAFMRGRNSSNLFGAAFNDELLQSRVGEYRQRLKLEETVDEPGVEDKAAFIFWATISAFVYVVSVGLLALIPSLVIYGIFIR